MAQGSPARLSPAEGRRFALTLAAAFAVLTALAAAGWPGAPRLRLLLGLSGFGVLIELVQMIPALHRSADWRDWLADTGAILAVLAIAAAIGPLRNRRRRRDAPGSRAVIDTHLQ